MPITTKTVLAASAAACALIATSLLAATPASAVTSAQTGPEAALAAGAPADAPAYDPSVPAPGPGDLTWSQVPSATSEGATFSAPPVAPAAAGSISTKAVTPISAPNGQRCTIDTGNVYKRKSGGIYPYGAVGGHPTTQCTVIMARISQTTEIYKTVWWGLQKVAGPFNSVNAGQGRLEQTSPIRKCDDLRETTFRMIVRSTGTFPTGSTGTASAYEEAKLPCGTNP